MAWIENPKLLDVVGSSYDFFWVIEVKRIVEDYNVGLTVHVENILALRRSIAAVAEHREAYDPGLKHAQEALSWEKECIPLRNFYAQFL